MYLAGRQLFSSGELKAWLAARERAAEAFVAALTPDELAARSDAALESLVVSRFRVPEAHLRVEEAYFVEERALTVAEAGLPTEGLPSEGGAPPAPDAMLTSITIAVPFQGPPELFTHRPSVFSAHQPEAEVVGQELHLGFIVPPELEHLVQQRFQQHIALIERSLEVAQWQAMDFNGELPGKARRWLGARRAALAAPG